MSQDIMLPDDWFWLGACVGDGTEVMGPCCTTPATCLAMLPFRSFLMTVGTRKLVVLYSAHWQLGLSSPGRLLPT